MKKHKKKKFSNEQKVALITLLINLAIALLNLITKLLEK